VFINVSLLLFLYHRSKQEKTELINTGQTNKLQDFLTELNKIMTSTILLEDLVDKLLTRLFTELKVSEGTLLLFSEDKITWAKTIGYKSNPVFDEKILFHFINENFTKEVLIVNLLEDSTIKHYFLGKNFTIIVPLKAKNILEGAIILGKNTSNANYTPND